MKKIIFLLLLTIVISDKSKAQLDIVGMPSLCGSIGVIFSVVDANCNSYRANPTTVTAGNIYPINLASPGTYVLGVAPTGVYGIDYWVINSTVRTQCFSGGGTPITCPNIDLLRLSDATTALPPPCSTAGNPQSDCFEYGTGCSCPAGTVVSASIGAGGSGQQIIIQ